MRLLLPRFPFLGASAYPHMYPQGWENKEYTLFRSSLVSNLKFLLFVLYGFNVRLISQTCQMFPTPHSKVKVQYTLLYFTSYFTS